MPVCEACTPEDSIMLRPFTPNLLLWTVLTLCDMQVPAAQLQPESSNTGKKGKRRTEINQTIQKDYKACTNSTCLKLQVVPFASAFRPVLPTKRDSNISRSPLPSSNPTSAFHPVGSSSRPGGSLPIQTQPSANAALPEPPQPGSEATDSPATAREQQRQRSPQQEAQPAV